MKTRVIPVYALLLGVLCCQLYGQNGSPKASSVDGNTSRKQEDIQPLPRPVDGGLPVAFVLGEDAEVMDFTGPLEVFASAWTPEGKPLFRPYFVASHSEPVKVGGGMQVVPDYTFATAPRPKIIVIPAMRSDTPDMIDWIKQHAGNTDVTMSVCNGAFVLAKTGLLDGKPATAHHGSYFRFAGTYPNVQLKRGARFVETGNLASSGGISSAHRSGTSVLSHAIWANRKRNPLSMPWSTKDRAGLMQTPTQPSLDFPSRTPTNRYAPYVRWRRALRYTRITWERRIIFARNPRSSSSTLIPR